MPLYCQNIYYVIHSFVSSFFSFIRSFVVVVAWDFFLGFTTENLQIHANFFTFVSINENGPATIIDASLVSSRFDWKTATIFIWYFNRNNYSGIGPILSFHFGINTYSITKSWLRLTFLIRISLMLLFLCSTICCANFPWQPHISGIF